MSKLTKQDLEEKFGKPCIEIIPNAANPQDPGTMPEEIHEQIINCLENTTTEVRRFTPNLPNSRIFRKWGITILNQPFQLDAIEFAIEHPDTVPVTVDVEAWLNNMKRFNNFMIIFRMVVNLLEIVRRAFRFPAVFSFESFSNYYKNVKMLSAEGNNEAQVIYERLRPLFNRFGRFIHSTNDDNHKVDKDIDFEELHGIVIENNIRITNLLKKNKNSKR
jgi:hypothetical protein